MSRFKAHAAYYLADAWKNTSSGMYLYAVSQPESVGFKSSAGPLSAYAAAISTLMLISPYVGNRSLNREVEASGPADLLKLTGSGCETP